MLRLLLPLLLNVVSAGDESWKPTEPELRRAHELLAGSWQFVSITDRGDKLGPKLVGSRLAQDGLLTIANREIAIVNPETGDRRTARFRIDPSASPQQIDMITNSDRIYRGIYKFDLDDLVFCLQPGDSKPRPDDFSSPEDSDRILIRLRVVGRSVTAATPSVAASATRTSTERPRDPAPSRIHPLRGHEMLAGSWDIVSIVDDGSILAPDLIKAKFAENGRVTIGSRDVALVNPVAGERRVSAIRIDSSKSPAEIDLTTRFDEVLRGIYRFESDQLVVCLAKTDDVDRPTDFKAPSGSNLTLFRMKMAPKAPATPPVTTLSTALPVPKLTTSTETSRDDEIRQRITGSWKYNDSKGTLTLVFRSNGTFSATRSWRSGLRRLFEGDTTTSDGRWSYARGALDATVSSTQDIRLLSRNYNYGVQSVGDNTLVVKNVFGDLMTAQRLR